MAIVQVAFYKGRTRLFNRAVAWWTRGPYSHCELVIQREPDGAAHCWSSSLMDGGVRSKVITLDPDHWDVVSLDVTPDKLVLALDWFEQREGSGYDVLGLLGFIWRAAADNSSRWFCSEALAAALGFIEPWRFSPNDLYAALSRN